MDSGKLIFDNLTNPLSTSTEINPRSSISFKKTVSSQRLHEKSANNDTIKTISTQNLEEKKNHPSNSSIKITDKSSKKNLITIGKYDNDTLQEIEVRRKTMYVSQSDFLYLTEEPIERFIKRDSIDNKSHRVSANTQVSGVSSYRSPLSDNVPVHSMYFDLPPSDELSTEEADFYVNILDRVREELELVKYIIPAEIDEKWEERYQPVDRKYKNHEDSQLELRDFLDPDDKLTLVGAKKLQRDRLYACNVVKEIVQDLKVRKRYDRLEKEIDSIAKTMEDEHNLYVNHEIWSEQLEQLKKLIETEKLDHEKLVENLIEAIRESAVGIDDSIFSNNSKLIYIEKWENSRSEGQKYRLELKEQMLQEELSECERIDKVDEIISGQLRDFLDRDIARLEEETVEWLKRYNDTMDKHQQEIENVREAIGKAKEELEKKENLQIIRRKFVEECKERRRIIAEKEEYWCDVHKAAVVVQSLWRGTMVRRQLGQYRGLWKTLKKRKKLAEKKRKKLEARKKKLEAKKKAEEEKKKRR